MGSIPTKLGKSLILDCRSVKRFTPADEIRPLRNNFTVAMSHHHGPLIGCVGDVMRSLFLLGFLCGLASCYDLPQIDGLDVDTIHNDPNGTDLTDRQWRRIEPVAITADSPPGNGLLKVARPGGTVMAIPIQETRFDVRVSGTVAETTVTQVFMNPFDDFIEAVYVFPLPNDGAVDAYGITIGDRLIHGVMKEREEARQIYEQARAEGRNAGLLEQERPNIFTQSIANIGPDQIIIATIHIVQPLRLDEGMYSFALPTTVGPRFMPGESIGRQGDGWSPDTDRVPDASRVSPQYLPKGQRSGHDLIVDVSIDAGMKVRTLESTSHPIEVYEEGNQQLVRLADDEAIPNKDFVLRWTLATDLPQAALLTQEDEEGTWFTLTLQPPVAVEPVDTVARELIFVVDNSCSMSGAPMQAAKDAMRMVLKEMNPNDSFMVMRFSESASSLAAEPLPNTSANLKRGLEYVDAMRGMGGTHMLAGIEAALGFPSDPQRIRFVLFLTDGYIGNEKEIFASIDANLGATRLFALGVGSSVNRFLLDGMAREGRGAVTYLGLDDDPSEVVDSFYQRIAYPVLADVALEWGDLPVVDVVPERIPDLFVGQPVTVYGRLEGGGSGTISLNGRLGREFVSLPVDVDLAGDGMGSGLRSMWARMRVDDLTQDPFLRWAAPSVQREVKEEVIEIALAHSVMTEYTAFVAVDEQVVINPDGSQQKVAVAVDMPYGVSHDAIFGVDETSKESSRQITNGSAGAMGIRRRGTTHGGGGYSPPAKPTTTSPRPQITSLSDGDRSTAPVAAVGRTAPSAPMAVDEMSGRSTDIAEDVSRREAQTNQEAVHTPTLTVTDIRRSSGGADAYALTQLQLALESLEPRILRCLVGSLVGSSNIATIEIELTLKPDGSVDAVSLKGRKGISETGMSCLIDRIDAIGVSPGLVIESSTIRLTLEYRH